MVTIPSRVPISNPPRVLIVMQLLKRVAPYMLLGPISGPLTAASVHYFKKGEPVMGALYVFVTVQVFFLLPILVAKLSLNLL
jgi:hypothetical protein